MEMSQNGWKKYLMKIISIAELYKKITKDVILFYMEGKNDAV